MALDGTMSTECVWKLLLLETTRLEASYLSYAFGTTLAQTHYRTSLPEKWRIQYQNRGYARIDPIVVHNMNSMKPEIFDFPELESDPKSPTRLKEMARELARLKIHTAFVVPVRGKRKEAYGSFVLLFDRRRSDVERLLDHQYAYATAIFWASHVRLAMLRKVEGFPPEVRLTKREREVYRLLAAGYSPDAISEKLGIGRRTVDMHFSSGRTRLNAKTREEALAQALLSGEVQL